MTARVETKRKARGIDEMSASYEERFDQSFAFGLMSTEVKAFCLETYPLHYRPGMKPAP